MSELRNPFSLSPSLHSLSLQLFAFDLSTARKPSVITRKHHVISRYSPRRTLVVRSPLSSTRLQRLETHLEDLQEVTHFRTSELNILLPSPVAQLTI